MSISGSAAEIEMEVATDAEAEDEEVGFHDNLTTQQLPAEFQEDIQHLNSSGVFSAYPTCMDPPKNIRSKSRLLKERIAEAASSSNMDLLTKADSSSYKNISRKKNRASRCMQQAIVRRNQLHVDLTGQFATLASIVPGTEEEMDESNVLEASIIYMKHLQERLQVLERQSHSESETCTSDENIVNEPQPLPLIDARLSERNVLIRIHCELCKGILARALDKTEKLHLSVVNSSAIPFGDSTLDVTITAEMDDEFKMTVKDLVKSLRSSLIQFAEQNRTSKACDLDYVQERKEGGAFL